MNHLLATLPTLIDLATAAAPAAPRPGWLQMLGSFGPIILMLAIFYFILLAPKRKEEKQRQSMLAALSKGDKVQTIGGVLGSILDVRDDKVQVKVDESSNVKIWFTRSAIHRVITDDAKTTDTAKADAKK